MSFDIRRGASCLRASKGLFWKEKGVMSRPRGCFPWCGLTSVSRSICLGHGTSGDIATPWHCVEFGL